MLAPQFDSANTSSTATWGCFRHTIQFDYARGNQHQRTEYGFCTYCGLKHKRVIRWSERLTQGWRVC